MDTNRRVTLVERPRYMVPTANCFALDQAPKPQVTQDGDVLVRTLWLAMESSLYVRVHRISAVQKDPVRLKDPMIGSAVGRVEESRHPRFKPGDLVSGLWGWQDYTVLKGERLRNLDFGPKRPSYALGAHGLAGFAAYLALEDGAPPKPGDTVVVSTAMGSLGHLAAQIAKLKGCRTVGIAGSAEKCQLAVEKLGIDACVSHNAKDFAEQLRAACPQGIDSYVETLGGRALDAVMPLMRLHGQIAALGLMASPTFGEAHVRGRFQYTMNYISELIARRITVRGLFAPDHVAGRIKAFDSQMKAWIEEGKIRPLEDIVVGLENAPEAFQGVFEGKNRGTRIVKVAD